MDWDTLARTIYGEARGEIFHGQVAVAWTVMNRVSHPDLHWWGRSVTEVCRKPYQYSCWLPGDPNLDVLMAAGAEDPSFLRALGIAALVMGSDLPDPTHGATHYHADTIEPQWQFSPKMLYRCSIGHHTFYREEA